MQDEEASGSAKRVLNALRQLIREVRLADRSGLKEHGLGSAQLYILHHLAAESPLSVNDLASRTATDQSTVSVVVNKLEEKGLLDRRRSQADARRTQLSLTRRGRAIAARLPIPFQETFLAALGRVPERQLQVLADTLDKVLDSMGVDGDPPMLLEDR
ncbi:MAG TPA: MarR family transcriptional regulator [Thermoanaerobaculia bacterium]|nr:MarR family transcriptional regulator [Thermoanaerobaculia bacterium]